MAPSYPDDEEPEGEMLTFVAGAEDEGQRVDQVLARHSARMGLGLSRTRVQRLLSDGLVTLDGAPASQSRVKIKFGSTLMVELPKPTEGFPSPEAIPLDVVYEDDHLLVLDKQAGIVVHPAAGHPCGTLVNALIAHCGPTLSGIGGVRRPGIVHRLDKGTTGLMVVAKTDRAHTGLSAIFADHGRSGSLVRDYLAFVWSAPGRRSGRIDAPLGRHPHNRDRMAVVPGRGRAAVTHYEIETEFPGGAARVRCRLETGRTHQIRVHLAHIGHPLIADPVYATGFRTKALQLHLPARSAIDALGRPALHAAVLGFDHPVTGATLRFETPLPRDLRNLEDALCAVGFSPSPGLAPSSVPACRGSSP